MQKALILKHFLQKYHLCKKLENAEKSMLCNTNVKKYGALLKNTPTLCARVLFE
jgi:hypothetical protein